jgi:hypothetical protein
LRDEDGCDDGVAVEACVELGRGRAELLRILQIENFMFAYSEVALKK